MKIRTILFISVLLSLYPNFSHSKQTSLRCNNKLVRTGAYKAEVLQKCGEPFYKEETHNVDQWSYQLGPVNDLWVFVFKNGQVESINSTRRGSHASMGGTKKTTAGKSSLKSMRCGRNVIRLDDYKALVLQKCGKPFFEEKRRKLDQWSYQTGPRNDLYILSFEGGKVKSINKARKSHSQVRDVTPK